MLLINCFAVAAAIFKPFQWWGLWALTGRMPSISRREFLVWLATLAVAAATLALTAWMN